MPAGIERAAMVVEALCFEERRADMAECLKGDVRGGENVDDGKN
jgi:hypothetical protein